MEKVLDQWREKLLDLTKRNRLINCRLGKGGAVPLEHPDLADVIELLLEDGDGLTFAHRKWLLGARGRSEHEDDGPLLTGLRAPSEETGAPSSESELTACLNSPKLRPNTALTPLSDKELKARLYRLYLSARTAQQEQGVNTLYLALGFLRWFESDDDADGLVSPLLQAPVQLKRVNVDAPWELSLLDEDVVRNFALAHLLKTNFKILLPSLDESPDAAACLDYFEAIGHECSRHARWELIRQGALGLFSFQKMAMWEDLGKNRGAIGSHGMCRAIGGDVDTDAIEPVELPDCSEFDDTIHPKDTFHIRDCDSSQFEAILAVKKGSSLIIDGPPGTGKSQTIANVIAEFLAEGKSVLFVSEKVAALEVVKRRLDGCNLGDFCLELHSHKANKKAVIDELGRCLYLPRSQAAVPHQHLHDLFKTRRQLNEYTRALHVSRAPMGISLFQGVGRFGRYRGAKALTCDIPNVTTHDEDRLARATEVVRELARLGHVARQFDSHPWHECSVKETSLTFQRSIGEQLPQLIERLKQRLDAHNQLRELGFVSAPATVATLSVPLNLAREALKSPCVPAAWFEGDVIQLTKKIGQLDADARQFSELRSRLRMFRFDTLGESDLETLAQFVRTTSEAERPLRQHLHAGVRNLLAHVEAACGALQALSDALERFTASDRELRESIGVDHCDYIADASRVARLARAVEDVGPSKRTWFTTETRARLRPAVDASLADQSRAAAIRSEVSGRLSEAAFDCVQQELLDQCVQYDRWWKRLFRGWRRRRGRLVELYRDGARPTTKQLLSDAALLIEYHGCNARVGEIARSNETELPKFEDGTIDWKGGQRSLQRIDDFIADWGSPPPDQLVSLLVDWERARAELVIEEADALDATSASLRDAVDAASIFVRHIGGRGQRWDRMSVVALMEWVEECSTQLATWKERLGGIAGLLVDGQDVAWSSVPDQLHELARSLRLFRTIQDQYRAVEHALPGIVSPETHDWTDEASLAAWLRGFVNRWDGRPPAHLVAVCSDSSRRDSVAAAVSIAERASDETHDKGWSLLTSLFPLKKSVSRGIVIGEAHVSEVIEWIEFLLVHIDELREWLDLCSVRRRLAPRGLAPLFDRLREGTLDASEIERVFLRRFWELWLDAAFDADQHLSAFRSLDHDDLVERFRQLDEQAIELSAKRIRGTLLADPKRPDGEKVGGPLFSELRVLRHEMEKKKRHLPLRQLFNKIPQVLKRLKPCVMMSPLSVSTFFDSDMIRFDLVIFDEASQVRPHDSIGAVYRGNQLVVAGDQRQLPPTSFFEHGDLAAEDDDDQEEELSTADLESILDVCQTVGLPRRRLRWHYRSRREPLIAFSNRHIYRDELMTFPSVLDADGEPAIEFVPVEAGRFKGGTSGGFNPIEARRAAEIVIREMRQNPTASVGVVTFGLGQRDAVQDAIDELRRNHHVLEPLFAEDEDEPFFVKNLENVQGDERDLMVFSIGYAPDESGKFAMRFGPLNQAGGERRLNVAVTRARSRVIVVSSIRAEQIDLSKTKAVGVKLLRAYLDYAERGPSVLGSEVREDSERESESEFEREVGLALEGEGFLVKRQVGCGGFRIDLALATPENAGRYILGVECDGATYHRQATARDRDRLRQHVLEQLGWRICRIWSTSWYRDPRRELQRIGEAFREALEAARAREQSKPPPSEPARVTQSTTPSIISVPPKTGPAEKKAMVTGTATVGNPPPLNGSKTDVETWIRSVDADTWLDMASWGKRTGNFEWGEQRLLNDVAVRVRTGAPLTDRLVFEARRLLEIGRVLGYLRQRR